MPDQLAYCSLSTTAGPLWSYDTVTTATASTGSAGFGLNIFSSPDVTKVWGFNQAGPFITIYDVASSTTVNITTPANSNVSWFCGDSTNLFMYAVDQGLNQVYFIQRSTNTIIHTVSLSYASSGFYGYTISISAANDTLYVTGGGSGSSPSTIDIIDIGTLALTTSLTPSPGVTMQGWQLPIIVDGSTGYVAYPNSATGNMAIFPITLSSMTFGTPIDTGQSTNGFCWGSNGFIVGSTLYQVINIGNPTSYMTVVNIGGSLITNVTALRQCQNSVILGNGTAILLNNGGTGSSLQVIALPGYAVSTSGTFPNVVNGVALGAYSPPSTEQIVMIV